MPHKTTSRRSLGKEGEVLQQTQRLLTWSAYQESLKAVDQNALRQFQLTVNSIRVALWVRVGVYLLQFLVVSAALFIGLYNVFKSPNVNLLGSGISLMSFLILAILLFRNPIASINRILVDLVRVQIILQGFTRQINQVDATFKQDFLEKRVGIKTVADSLAQVQKVIDGNIESLVQFLEEMHI